MVENTKSGFFDDSDDDSPILVAAAHAIPDLNTLEPIGVHVVTIDGDALQQCQASVISNESSEVTGQADGIRTEEMVDESTQTWSAGIAGGVVGTLVGGPLLGVVAGGAAAYYSRTDGAAGDVSRAMGEVARTTSKKAQEINEKHNLVDKSKQAAGSAWNKVKDINTKHQIAEKSQEAASKAWENAKEFNEKHGVMDKLYHFAALVVKQFTKFIEEVSGKLLENREAASRAPEPIPQREAVLY